MKGLAPELLEALPEGRGLGGGQPFPPAVQGVS